MSLSMGRALMRMTTLTALALFGCNALLDSRNLEYAPAGEAEGAEKNADADSGTASNQRDGGSNEDDAEEIEDDSGTEDDGRSGDCYRYKTVCVYPGDPLPGLPPRGPNEVNVTTPTIISATLRLESFVNLTVAALPAIEACNSPRQPRVVKIDTFLNFGRMLGLVFPSANVDAGEPTVAQCVATALKSAQKPEFFTDDEDGIFKEASFIWN